MRSFRHSQRPGESFADYCHRLIDECEARKAAARPAHANDNTRDAPLPRLWWLDD